MTGARWLLLAAALGAAGCGSLRSDMIGFTVVGAGLEGGGGYLIAPAGKQSRAAVVGTVGGAVSGALISYGLHRLGILETAHGGVAAAEADAPGFDGRPGGWLLVADYEVGLGSENAAQEWRRVRREQGFRGAAVLWRGLLDLTRLGKSDPNFEFIGVYGSFATMEDAGRVSSEDRYAGLPFRDGILPYQAQLLTDPGALPRLVEVLIRLPPGPAERSPLVVVTPERSTILGAAKGGEASVWVAHAGKVSVDVRFPGDDVARGRCFAGTTHAEATIGAAEAGPPETTPPVWLALGHRAVPCPR